MSSVRSVAAGIDLPECCVPEASRCDSMFSVAKVPESIPSEETMPRPGAGPGRPDFRRAWRARIVGVCLALAILVALLWSDDWLRSQRSLLPGRVWSGLALGISGSANGGFLIPILVGGAIWFDRRGRRRFARTLAVMLLSGIVAGLAGTALRSVIGRTRPEVSVKQGWFGPRLEGRWLIGKHAYGSFPSGHASMAAGLGVMAFALGRRWGVAGMTFAVAVAWSRFHLGAHRASDVWAGLMLGSMTSVVLWPFGSAWVRDGRRPGWWPEGVSFLVEPSPKPTETARTR